MDGSIIIPNDKHAQRKVEAVLDNKKCPAAGASGAGWRMSMNDRIVAAQENMEAKMLAFIRDPSSANRKLAMAAHHEFFDAQLDDWVEQNFMGALHAILTLPKARANQQSKERQIFWAMTNDMAALEYYPKDGARGIAI